MYMNYARFLAAFSYTDWTVCRTRILLYTRTPSASVSCSKTIGHNLHVDNSSVCEYSTYPCEIISRRFRALEEHWCSKRAIRDDDRDRDGGGRRMVKGKKHNKYTSYIPICIVRVLQYIMIKDRQKQSCRRAFLYITLYYYILRGVCVKQ